MTTTTRTNANDHYQYCSGGSDRFYKHWLGFTYTEGVKQVAEDCGAYWFIDLIASYRTHKRVRCESFQTWELRRTQEDRFLVTATDGNENKLITQKIPSSDFQYDDLTLWCVNGVIMLPCEY